MLEDGTLKKYLLMTTLKGFSPLCCLMCVRRIEEAVKAFVQNVHLYGRSPE